MATFAIGDVHGMMAKLDALLDKISFSPTRDRLVFLGDLIDRGPQSREVVERVLALKEYMGERLICLRGNHEEMLLNALDDKGRESLVVWLENGGAATMKSYGVDIPAKLPPAHRQFFRSLPLWWEDEDHLYVHADVEPDLQPWEMSEETLLWGRGMNEHTLSGKIVVCGHTPQAHRVLRKEWTCCIDTGACYSHPGMGLLTAMKMSTHEIYQV
ncbi:MAG: serine/threonine protein phosphatase [Nitrospirota bacterium]|nr:serine/threonine protein phosphatase [Nitrospirota bacterium]